MNYLYAVCRDNGGTYFSIRYLEVERIRKTAAYNIKGIWQHKGKIFKAVSSTRGTKMES